MTPSYQEPKDAPVPAAPLLLIQLAVLFLMPQITAANNTDPLPSGAYIQA